MLDKLRRQSLVMHFHGPWSTEALAEAGSSASVAAKRDIESLVLRRGDRVIVLSQAFADLLQRQFNVREDRIRLVPRHVDLGRFAVGETKAEAHARLGVPQDRTILLTVRRLKQRMGLERQLDALTPIAATVPEDVLLCIAGSGELRPMLERRAAALGLADHVRFLGFVPEEDLPSLYCAADLNVVPTIALEGFGLVAAEALAAGTPSIVTPIGGLPDVVAPLSTDLVFASTEPADMADHLISALRGQICLPGPAACERYAKQKFAVSLAAARTAEVYRGMIA